MLITAQHISRRTATWGAGFLFEHQGGFAIVMYEHDVDAAGEMVRRRLRDVAAEHDVVPCTERATVVDARPHQWFCFDVDPLDVVHPHADGNHSEWFGSMAVQARIALKELGLLFIGPGEFIRV